MNTAVATLVLAVICSAASGTQDIYRHCRDGNTGDVEILDVKLPSSDCSSVPCRVTEGTNHTIVLAYRAKNNLGPMSSHFFGILQNIHTPIPFLKRDNFCDYVDSCATKVGQTAVYKDKLLFPSGISGLNVMAMFQLRDRADKIISCITIPARVIKEY